MKREKIAGIALITFVGLLGGLAARKLVARKRREPDSTLPNNTIAHIPLDRTTVTDRIQGYSYNNNYLYLGGIMKSVALAAGALVLLGLVADFSDNWPRLLPWLGSLLLVLLTHITWGRGALLTNSRSNVFDSAFPLLMGIAEFLLFAILVPPNLLPQETITEAWRWWFFVVAGHAGLAIMLISNRIKQTFPRDDFDSDLWDLADQSLRWTRKDRWGATLATIVAVTFGILSIFVLPGQPPDLQFRMWFWIMTSLMMVFFCIPIYQADKQRNQIASLVLKSSARN